MAARGALCDQRRGLASVGSAARDASAYALWAAARALPSNEMAPLLSNVVAPTLVAVALCDREVNCRRAAAAAMQETVGRQKGKFPHGIAIVTLVDFFAVSQLAHCYRELVPKIAQVSLCVCFLKY